MLAETKRILDKALDLPEEDRRHVAERLINSIPDTDRAQLEEAWNEEARSRAAAAVADQVASIDGEEALAGIEKKLRRIKH